MKVDIVAVVLSFNLKIKLIILIFALTSAKQFRYRTDTTVLNPVISPELESGQIHLNEMTVL